MKKREKDGFKNMEGWLNSLSYSDKQTNEMKRKRNKEQHIKGMRGTGRKKD
jgi:hypothetical protein